MSKNINFEEAVRILKEHTGYHIINVDFKKQIATLEGWCGGDHEDVGARELISLARVFTNEYTDRDASKTKREFDHRRTRRTACAALLRAEREHDDSALLKQAPMKKYSPGE